MASIAIVGPGAIGGLVAAHLIHTQRHEVVLCARRAIGELVLRTADGVLASTSAVLTAPEQASAVDWVLIATKAYDAAPAAKWLQRLRGKETPVAVLQNGVEHRERFAPWVAAEHLVPVMVDCPAERISASEIQQRGPAKMAVADNPLGRAFAGLFSGSPIDVEVVADFKSTIWRKLCLNSAGILSALLLKPAGIMRDDRIAEVARGLVRECIAVGRAEGAVLDDSVVESVIQSYRGAPPDAVNSLHADRAAGRAMEVDARNGVIVRLGRKHGVPTPLNQMAATLLEMS